MIRRFNYANRSTLFTQAVSENVTAKRAFLGTEKEFNFTVRVAFFLGLTATAGLIFGAYKAVRYIDNALDNIPRVDEDQLEPRGAFYGPKNNRVRPV